MRNALILLAIVAAVILVFGAFNHGVVFNIDYVAGTANQVSLFWVSGVIAAIIFVAGLAASWLALSGAAVGRRKLEAELQTTYERLRKTEAQAAEAEAAVKAAAARAAEALPAAPLEATVVAEQEAPTVVAEPATVVAGDEAETVVAEGPESVPVDEAPTLVAGEAEAAADGAAEPAAAERTAVTMTGVPVAEGADTASAEQDDSPGKP